MTGQFRVLQHQFALLLLALRVEQVGPMLKVAAVSQIKQCKSPLMQMLFLAQT
jgi:hypothetical protein